MQTQDLISTLRLSRDELKELLGAVREQRDGCRSNSKRRHSRLWLGKVTPIDVTLPPQTMKSYATLGLDLSAGGIGLLAGTFLYPNARVVVRLPMLSGTGDVPIEGVIKSCVHFMTRWHRIGIQFSVPIYPADFTVG